MPAITPQEWGPGLIVRHAVSQGYVLYLEQLLSKPPVSGNVWVPVDEVTMQVTIDEPSSVLQLFRCTTFLGLVGSPQMRLRLRFDSQASEYQTAEHDTQTFNGMDNDHVLLFRAWPNVPPGVHTFGVETMVPYSGSWNWWAVLRNMRHALAVLKR